MEKSAAELSRQIDDDWFLRDRAFKPTGIALGCPFPDHDVIKRLWQTAKDAAERIAQLCPDEGPSMSFVPRSWYHMTVVNRSHYSVKDSMSGNGSMVNMREQDRKRVEEVVAKAGFESVMVNLEGLLLTRKGILIVPGQPADEGPYKLRHELAREMPQLSVNVPNTWHVKLGHLIAPAVAAQSDAAVRVIDCLNDGIRASLTFRDLYTPLGRINL